LAEERFTMPARYTLHGSFRSGPTYKVGLMLSLAGEPFDYVHVNMREGEHKTPAYMARQRYGQVPLLIDNSNGRGLCQSASILEYLADRTGKFGGGSLEERIEAREWMFWEFDRLAPNIYRPRAAKAGFRQFDPAVLAQYEADGAAALKALDTHLAGRTWLVGEGPTIADIDVYGVVRYAPEGGYDLDAFPNVSAWKSRVEALPGFGDPGALLPMESKAAA
jgi:glutathione S-transferase